MKQKRQVVLLLVLMVVAGGVWSSQWTKRTPGGSGTTFITTYKPLSENNPSIHWDVLKRVQGTEYKSSGRNPFVINAAPPDAQSKPKPKPTDIVLPPPPPPPPTEAKLPPNLKYFGYGTIPAGSPRRAFITDGEDIYIVTEGDTLLGRYRIIKVGPANLEFQEISSGLPGKAPLEEQAAPPSV